MPVIHTATDASSEITRPKTKTERPRLEALDGVRAIAAISILFTHYIGAYRPSVGFLGMDATPWVETFAGGSTSLSMFFVLSGFILTNRYRMSEGLQSHQPFSLGSFYIQRIARIFPTFIFILLVSWLCHGFFSSKPVTQPPQTEWAHNLWADNYGVVDIAKQAVFKSGTRSADNLLPQDWTLRVTTKFILITPFLIILATRSSRWLIVFTLIAVTLLRAEIQLVHFTMGILISKHQAWIAASLNKNRRVLSAGGVALVALLYTSQHMVHSLDLKWIAAGATAAGLLLCAIHLESFKRLLSSSVLGFTGKISFGIYLWHLLVLITIVPMLIKQLNRWNITDANIIHPIAFFALCAITYLLSTISYYLVEQPSITLGKKLNALYVEITSPRQ